MSTKTHPDTTVSRHKTNFNYPPDSITSLTFN